MDAYFCVADFLESLSTDTQDPETPSQDEKTQQDSDSAIQYIIRILDKALEARDRAASSRYDDVVEQVMKYIEENYAEEELSLNLLASHVNFSPNHLSMIFSQQTGMSFIKYLTDYRMNKAKELLRCTGKRSSLISQEVGYKDPHYFSYLFKKDPGDDTYPVSGRHQIATIAERTSYEKKVKRNLRSFYARAKIRYSYLCLLVPFVLFLIFCFYNLWNNNSQI